MTTEQCYTVLKTVGTYCAVFAGSAFTLALSCLFIWGALSALRELVREYQGKTDKKDNDEI